MADADAKVASIPVHASIKSEVHAALTQALDRIREQRSALVRTDDGSSAANARTNALGEKMFHLHLALEALGA